MINDPSLFMLMSTIIVCASGISAYFFISNTELSSENHLANFVIMMLIFIVFYGLISVALGLLAMKFFIFLY